MTAKSPISLSVSIVCYHSPAQELEATIASLSIAVQKWREIEAQGVGSAEQDGSATAEPVTNVILIDNSESKSVSSEQVAALQQYLAPANCALTLIQGNGNVGYGAGHNLAIHSSKAEYHLILNPDVLLAHDSLCEGIRFLEQEQTAVLVSPAAQSPTGKPLFLCKRYPSVLLLFLRGFFPVLLSRLFAQRHAHYEMHDLARDEASKVPIASGCFMLCRRAALAESSGFDSRYFLYFEDFDLSLRLGKLGELVYLPSMKIIHAGGHAGRKGIKHIQYFIRAGIRFFNQWGWRWL